MGDKPCLACAVGHTTSTRSDSFPVQPLIDTYSCFTAGQEWDLADLGRNSHHKIPEFYNGVANVQVQKGDHLVVPVAWNELPESPLGEFPVRALVLRPPKADTWDEDPSGGTPISGDKPGYTKRSSEAFGAWCFSIVGYAWAAPFTFYTLAKVKYEPSFRRFPRRSVELRLM